MDEIFDKIFQEFADLNDRFNELEEVLTKENLIKRYSIQDLADNTPLGEQTIRAKIKDGTINAQRLGNKYLITAKEFNRVCKEAKSLKYKRQG